MPASTKQSTESERPPLQHRNSLLGRTPSASATPDIAAEVDKSADVDIDLAHANVDREVLIKHGKKMATDFKDGLWTFWEDLRQATVGDEATQVMPPNARRQKKHLKFSPRLLPVSIKTCLPSLKKRKACSFSSTDCLFMAIAGIIRRKKKS